MRAAAAAAAAVVMMMAVNKSATTGAGGVGSSGSCYARKLLFFHPWLEMSKSLVRIRAACGRRWLIEDELEAGRTGGGGGNK